MARRDAEPHDTVPILTAVDDYVATKVEIDRLTNLVHLDTLNDQIKQALRDDHELAWIATSLDEDTGELTDQPAFLAEDHGELLVLRKSKGRRNQCPLCKGVWFGKPYDALIRVGIMSFHDKGGQVHPR